MTEDKLAYGVNEHGQLVGIHDPGSLGRAIDKMYAFVSVDDDGEGIIGGTIGGMFMPLVGADLERMESLWPHAESIAKMTKKKVRLIEFSTRTVMETIEP